MKPLYSPTAQDSREDQADWVELCCILSEDTAGTSLQDVVGQLRKGGTVENDHGSERSESIAQDVFSELDSRERACGGDQYPFKLDAHGIERKPGYTASPYVFQLLLTHYGIVDPPGIPSPERVFEGMAAHAAGRYFGAIDPPIPFGFPRRYEEKDFHSALNHLCSQLGEGGGARLPDDEKERKLRIKKILEQKDGKLDVVAWRAFPDRREGKLVGFGQCACGKTDWRSKFSELQPTAFSKLWLRDPLSVEPVRMFFVPRRVEKADWADIAVQAGVLFDRCRIAHHSGGLSDALLKECEAWTKYMLSAKDKAPAKGKKSPKRKGRPRKKAKR